MSETKKTPTDSSQEKLPLFPLPNTVLFPDECLPLHIFEAKYQQLLKDIAETGNTFGIVFYRKDDKNENVHYLSRIGTRAEITDSESMADGKCNILVVGKSRFEIDTVDTETHPYFSATTKTYEDKTQKELEQSSSTDINTDDDDDDQLETKPSVPSSPDRLEYLLKEMIRLNEKIDTENNVVSDVSLTDEIEFDDESPMSFQVGPYLAWVPEFQQLLLESRSEDERIAMACGYIEKVAGRMAMVSQIENVFTDTTNE